MKQFMVDIDLPEFLPDEFLELIPSQREQVSKLLTSGQIISYALAVDRSKIWTVVAAESEDDAMDIVSTFPLIHHMRVDIFELAFNNSAKKITSFSLN
jgi:hypothetical protein